MSKDQKELIKFLLERIDHLESHVGECDCFDCFSDRERNSELMKKAEKLSK